MHENGVTENVTANQDNCDLTVTVVTQRVVSSNTQVAEKQIFSQISASAGKAAAVPRGAS